MLSSSSKNLVVVRHGQTQWNLEKRTQGHLDSPLTEQGVLQAKEIVQKLKDYKFDLVVSSPLGRALETAKIIAKELQIPEIQINLNLAERHLGVLQGCTKEELLKKFPQFFDVNNRFVQNSEIPEAESLQKFLQRTYEAVKKLQQLSKSKNVLAVTHDGVLHAIVSYIKNIDFSEVQRSYKFDHGEPVILS